MSIFKTLFKDTFIFGLGIVLPKVMNLALVGLHTSSFNPKEYGDVSGFYIYAVFGIILLSYGMETAFFRFYAKNENKNEILSTVSISLTATLIIATAIILPFGESIASALKIPLFWFYGLYAILFFETLWIVPFAYYRIRGKALKFFVIKVLASLVFVFFNFLFLRWIPYSNIELPELLKLHGVEYVFLANVLSSLAGLLLVFPVYFTFQWTFNSNLLKKMLHYSYPILIAGIAYAINENLDKLVIRDLIDKSTMGAYSACYKLTLFLTLFLQAFKMGVEPFFFNQAKAKNAKESYAVVLKFFVIFASLGILFVMSFIDILKELLIKNEDYWFALGIVPVVLLANWCFGVYQSLSVWYKVTDKTKFGMYFSIAGAILTIIFNYMLIPKIGYMASAYATLIAYGGMMLLSYAFGQFYYKISYDILRILSYLILSIGLSYLTWQLYPKNYFLKFVAILVYLTFVILSEKESIKRIINRT